MDAPPEIVCRFLSRDSNAFWLLREVLEGAAVDIKAAAPESLVVMSDENGIEINGWRLAFNTEKVMKENSLSSELLEGVASFGMGRDTVLPLLFLLVVAKRCSDGGARGNKVSVADSDGNALEPAIGPASPILARMGVEFEEVRLSAERLGLYTPGANDLLRRSEGIEGDGFWF